MKAKFPALIYQALASKESTKRETRWRQQRSFVLLPFWNHQQNMMHMLPVYHVSRTEKFKDPKFYVLAEASQPLDLTKFSQNDKRIRL